MSGAGPLLLLVEDEVAVRRFLRASLTAEGYRLLEAGTASEALMLYASHNPQCVLLDLGLPDGDGLELTRELRKKSRVPIVVLSARGREDDKVSALDAGADDYLTKPFGVRELLARVRVALRHAAHPSAASAAEPLRFGELSVDLERREVRVGEREVHLTPTEYNLLVLLAQNAGRVLTHRYILTELWGPSYATQSHYVRVHMAELRKKVEPDPARPRWLRTEPGVGYRFEDRGA